MGRTRCRRRCRRYRCLGLRYCYRCLRLRYRCLRHRCRNRYRLRCSLGRTGSLPCRRRLRLRLLLLDFRVDPIARFLVGLPQQLEPAAKGGAGGGFVGLGLGLGLGFSWVWAWGWGWVWVWAWGLGLGLGREPQLPKHAP